MADTLHLVSWNVAGWDATLKYIKSHYKSLEAFLDRLGVDILAVQEAKVQKSKLQTDPAAAYAHPFGEWESFWGVPASEVASGKTTPKRGFNGVTTFARKGLTLAADACPLGEASLDGEGRCLLTDHGGFVLLNVYAHATGEGDDYAAKLQRKLAFFAALRAKMQVLRDAGRRVVLCGDLNVACRGADVPWKQALLPVSALRLDADASVIASLPAELEAPPAAEGSTLAEINAASKGAAAAQAMAAAARLHEALGGAAALRSLARRLSARAVLRVGEVLGEAAKVVRREPDPEPTDDASALDEAEGEDWGGADADGAEPRVGSGADPHCSEPDADGPGQAEALAAVASALAELSHVVGKSNSQRDCVAWMRALLEDDGMCDTFAALRPTAKQRFTCWNQYTNQRYVNVGKRIDYFLIDGPLVPYLRRGPSLVEDDSEDGALRAATANRRWLPAPMKGADASLQEASMTTHNSQFLPGPHTGIFYTAPPASDHVAVSLLLDVAALGRPKALPPGGTKPPLDAATKACTFRPQASLKSFFAPKMKRPADEQTPGCSSASHSDEKKPKA